MRKFTNINLAIILFILIMSTSQTFAQDFECKAFINVVKKGLIGRTIDLVKDKDVNCESNGDGTPLINAVRSENLTMVAVLTTFGADVNKGLARDGNPLIQASKIGNIEIVAYLINKGADVNAFVEEDETPLINAAAKGNLKVVKFLVAYGADVNKAVWSNSVKGRELRSPLNMAKRNNQKKVAKFLIQQGATK